MRIRTITVSALLLAGALGTVGCSGSNDASVADSGPGDTSNNQFPEAGPIDASPSDGSPEASHEAGTPSLSWAPSAAAFGMVAAGASPTLSLTLTNDGTGPSGAVAMAWTGAGVAAFALSSDACSGKSLAPQTSCTVVVTFDPKAAGQDDATLTASAEDVTATEEVSGTAVAASSLAFTAVPAFASETVGQTSKQTVTLTNSGGTASAAVTLGLTGADAASFSLAADTCTGKTLAPAGTCTAELDFAPTTGGAKSATLGATVAGVLAASTPLSGAAVTAASLAFSTPQAFGPTAVGQKAPQTLTLTNAGGTKTASVGLALTGADAAMFSLANDGCTGTALAASGTCQVDVVFAPTSAGSRASTLTATAGTLSTTASLTATGVPPATLGASGITAYGPVVVGQKPSQHLTVTNGGGVATSALALVVGGTSKTAAAMYSLANDACTGKVLAAAGNCTADVVFTPTASGAQTASLGITAGALSTTVMLTGAGQTPAALGVTGTATLTAALGASTSQVFTVANSGDQTSGAITATLTGPASFKLTTSGCNTKTLAGDGAATCAETVSFTPSGTASQSATLTVSATPGGTQTVMLTGDAAAVLTISAPIAMTGVVGQPATTQILTVTNTGGVDTGALTATLTGSTTLTKTSDTCTGHKLAGVGGVNTCAVMLTFTPTGVTPQSATLAVAASPGGSPSVTVDAGGANPTVAFSITANGNAVSIAAPFRYPGTIQSSATSKQTFVAKNTGNVSSETLTASVVSGPFSVPASSDHCSKTILAAGATCDFDVVFTPTVPGPAEGQFALADGNTHATVTAWGPGLYSGSAYLITTIPDAQGLPAAIATNKLYDFGTVAFPATAAQTFTVTNYGTVALPTNLTVSDSQNSSSLIPMSSNACNGVAMPAYGTAASSCAYVMTFEPASGSPATQVMAYAEYTYDGDLMSSVELTGTP